MAVFSHAADDHTLYALRFSVPSAGTQPLLWAKAWHNRVVDIVLQADCFFHLWLLVYGAASEVHGILDYWLNGSVYTD